MKLYRSIFLSLLFVLALLPLTSVRGDTSPVEQLRPVGSTTLKVMFWTIYDSTLFSPNGFYGGVEPGIALQIDYRRNIKKDRLLDTTRDQWQELDLYQSQLSETWLSELGLIWPDIRRGDSIILYVEPDMSATFYHNEKLLGRIESALFTENFLAIWLAENSSFPEQQKELIGAR